METLSADGHARHVDAPLPTPYDNRSRWRLLTGLSVRWIFTTHPLSSPQPSPTMPVYLTPGVRFLAQSLLRVALPACIIGMIFRTLPRLDMFPQTWVLAALSLVAIPVVFAMSIAWSEISLRRRAAAMGARVAPRAEGKWIGNVDILRMMMRNWERGYPGAFLLVSLS